MQRISRVFLWRSAKGCGVKVSPHDSIRIAAPTPFGLHRGPHITCQRWARPNDVRSSTLSAPERLGVRSHGTAWMQLMVEASAPWRACRGQPAASRRCAVCGADASRWRQFCSAARCVHVNHTANAANTSSPRFRAGHQGRHTTRRPAAHLDAPGQGLDRAVSQGAGSAPVPVS